MDDPWIHIRTDLEKNIVICAALRQQKFVFLIQGNELLIIQGNELFILSEDCYFVFVKSWRSKTQSEKNVMFARMKQNFKKKSTPDGTSGFLLLSSNIPSQN